MSRHAARPLRATPKLTDLPPHLRAAAGAGAALGVLALALGAAAWTGPVATTTTVPHASSRSLTFSYSATVPRSAAYDGTVATSPDPIFRTLARTVDVHVAYQGPPGSITLSAELATASGWHTMLALAPTTAFGTPHYSGHVTLDLDVIDGRAAAAARATGLPKEQVTVRLLPEIRAAHATPFRPSLAMTLTPAQLKLAGDNTSLLVQDATPGSAQTRSVRTLGLLGQELPVRVARSLSIALLLLSLLATAALVLVARRIAPRSEAAGIRQRYSQLILTVMPIVLQPGRPVVDVPDIASLARLAERYGLLILHWSRGGTDTYLVQDEGTTFRYRTGSTVTAHDDATWHGLEASNAIGAR